MDSVVYAGFLVRFPIGGYAWQVVHYLTGLRNAGLDVYFYEDSRHYRVAYDPTTDRSGTDYSYGCAFARAFLERAGFGDRWVFHDAERDEFAGLDRERTRAMFSDARVLINAGGVNRFPSEVRRGKRTVYIDMDPAFTQLRVAGGDRVLDELLREHELHFTFGENIGTARSAVPDAGFEWRPTRQPVVLELWPPTPVAADAPFTTIGKWDTPGRDVVLNGERYTWRKRTEFLKVLELPRLTGAPFRIAMDVKDPADLRMLDQAGWNPFDPLGLSRDPDAYRRFISGSRAEFTTAKDVNVRLHSGWFSDRSACYLAAGRPVLTQDTGFGDVLPTGEGLFAYRTLDDAVAAVQAIMSEPERHSRAARRVAEGCFAAQQVVEKLLEPTV
ncbi:MAG TPA: glycosyltransferase [Candidatus Bathyarchaeia archaeon]|nr:glycosyltransferase [Candidatus Bathyarchaeia archaeon]